MARALALLMGTLVVAASLVGWVEASRPVEIADAGYVPPDDTMKQGDLAPGPLPYEDARLIQAARCTVSDMAIAEGISAEWSTQYHALNNGEIAVDEVQARAEGGELLAMEVLAFHLASAGDDVEALAGQWMMRAAEAGSVIAINEIGYGHIHGTLGLDQDSEAGARWLRQGIAEGDALASHNLADLIEQGAVAPPDDQAPYEAALEHYLDAAAGCYVGSLVIISERLKRGRGVPQDLETAGDIDRNVRIYRN